MNKSYLIISKPHPECLLVFKISSIKCSMPSSFYQLYKILYSVDTHTTKISFNKESLFSSFQQNSTLCWRILTSYLLNYLYLLNHYLYLLNSPYSRILFMYSRLFGAPCL